MSDKLIEAVAKAIANAALDANEAAIITPDKPFSCQRNTGGCRFWWDAFGADAKAVIAAIESQDFRVVPAEPTSAMEDAMYAIDKVGSSWPANADDIWRAMVSAAPKITGDGK